MKKRFLNCDIHGVALHRCKRKYWHIDKQRYSTEYKEECFKCKLEGKITKQIIIKKKEKFISLR